MAPAVVSWISHLVFGSKTVAGAKGSSQQPAAKELTEADIAARKAVSWGRGRGQRLHH